MNKEYLRRGELKVEPHKARDATGCAALAAETDESGVEPDCVDREGHELLGLLPKSSALSLTGLPSRKGREDSLDALPRPPRPPRPPSRLKRGLSGPRGTLC